MHSISPAAPSHVVVKDPDDGTFDTYNVVAWVMDHGLPVGVIIRNGKPAFAWHAAEFTYVDGPAQ